MLAAIQIRGRVDTRDKTKKALDHLNLDKRNKLVLMKDNDANRGQLSIAKDYIAYGEITEETVEKLEEATGNNLETGDTVNLSPPTGGYKNTRRMVGQGGSLGNRDDMDDLINKMV